MKTQQTYGDRVRSGAIDIARDRRCPECKSTDTVGAHADGEPITPNNWSKGDGNGPYLKCLSCKKVSPLKFITIARIVHDGIPIADSNARLILDALKMYRALSDIVEYTEGAPDAVAALELIASIARVTIAKVGIAAAEDVTSCTCT